MIEFLFIVNLEVNTEKNIFQLEQMKFVRKEHLWY